MPDSEKYMMFEVWKLIQLLVAFKCSSVHSNKYLANFKTSMALNEVPSMDLA